MARGRHPKHGLKKQKTNLRWLILKPLIFGANSALFQAAILASNTLRWMALCSGNKILRRWEAATIRTFLIRMAGKWTTGSRQQKLRVPKRMLYNAQWEAWVAVAET